MFDYLTLSVVIDDKIWCVHGGVSPKINNLDEIRRINRKMEVPHEGAMCDLMWSDPDEIKGYKPSPRGAGWLFGSDVVEKFLRVNGLNYIGIFIARIIASESSSNGDGGTQDAF